MPVKTLKPSYISVTGKWPSKKNGRMSAFESLLERSYFIHLDSDDSVLCYEEYPLELYWIDVTGRKRRYTPDVKVIFVDSTRRPVIVEVKSSQEVIENFDEFKLKYRSVRHQIHSKGFGFRLVTERFFNENEIKNLHFLKRYLKTQISEDALEYFYASVGKQVNKAYQIVKAISPSIEDQAYYQAQMWACVAQGHLITDLTTPLTNSALLTIPVEVL